MQIKNLLISQIPILGPYVKIIDARYQFFEDISVKDNKKLSVLESKIQKVERTLDMKEINGFKEINERRSREKVVIIFNFLDSLNAKNTDLNYSNESLK